MSSNGRSALAACAKRHFGCASREEIEKWLRCIRITVMKISDPQQLLEARETYLRSLVACGPNDCEGGLLEEWLEDDDSFKDEDKDDD
jgi:hypothetical protein